MSIFNSNERHDFKKEHKVDEENVFDILEGQYPRSLVAEQIALEHEQYILGEERFYRNLNRAVEGGRVSSAPMMSAPATVWWQATMDEINRRIEVELAKTGMAATHRMKWFKLTQDCEPEVLANLTLSVLLNHLLVGSYFSAHSAWKMVGEAVEKQIRFARIRYSEAVEWKRRYEEEFKKRASDLNRTEFMKRAEKNMVDEGKVEEWKHWDVDDVIRVGYELVCCVEMATGLFEHKEIPQYLLGNKGNKYITAIVLNPIWIEKLQELAFDIASNEPVFMPTVIPPRPWTDFHNGGYWSKGNRPFNIVQSHRRRNIVKHQAHHKMPKVLEAINLLQNTPWRVNQKVLDVVVELYDNDDKVEVTQRISKWPIIETFRPRPETDDVDTLNQWKEEAHAFYQEQKVNQSRRKSLDTAIKQAQKFSQYDQIFMPYYCDFRGRIYAAPSFNPQGGDVMKALLTPAQKKPMGERGWYWLRVHCATTGEIGGIDKEHPDVRADWVYQNLDQIMATYYDPIGNVGFWAGSINDKGEMERVKSPFQFLTAIFEVAAAIESGNPEQYESGALVAFDGSCSGLQHYSAMLRDEVGGAQVNLVPSDKKADVYGAVCVKVIDKLTEESVTGNPNGQIIINEETGQETYKPSDRSMAQNWLSFGIERGVTKRPVMTFCYSSKTYGMKEQVLKDTLDEKRPKKSKKSDEELDPIFKYDTRHSYYLADIVFKATSQTVIKASECMDYIQDVTDILKSEGKPLEWVTQDGFYVRQEYLEQLPHRPKLSKLVINQGVKIRQVFRPQFLVDPKEGDTVKFISKQRSSVAPNFIHSMDATHLRMTVRACHKKGVRTFGVIHDSFGTIPADAQTMFETVRETMVEMYQDNPCMLDQIDSYLREHSECKQLPQPPAKGKLNLSGIIESKYAFI